MSHSLQHARRILTDPAIAVTLPALAQEAWMNLKAAQGQPIPYERLARLTPAHLGTATLPRPAAAPAPTTHVADQIAPAQHRVAALLRDLIAGRQHNTGGAA